MDYLVGAASMLVIDGVYLNMVKDDWQTMVSGIQGSKLSVRMMPAIGVYILMTLALYYFIILPKRSVLDAALLGFAIYGVFDLTNMAIFKDYNVMIALTDMIWGSILFASSAFIVKMVMKK